MELLIDELRQDRVGRTVAYTQFLNDYKRKQANIVYGFVEAKEDVSLYYTCIYPELPQGSELCLIPCSGKYVIRETYKLIDWETYSKQRVCFFRDRDLSDYIEDDNDLCRCENCYLTDGYSIENSLITGDLLYRLLREVLGYSTDDYETIMNLVNKFVNDKKVFEDQFRNIMAHIIYWKKMGISSPLNNIHIKDLVNITKDKVEYKDEEARLSYIYSRAQVDKAKCDMTEIEHIENLISEGEKYRSIIRGHFVSEFFILYCNTIKKCSQMLSTRLDVNNILAPRCKKINSLSVFVGNTYLQYYNNI